MNGKFHGKGKCKWPDGTIYEGMFENNEANGYGIKTGADGSIYEGEWKDGM